MRALLLLAALGGCQADTRELIVVHPDGRTEQIAPCAKGCSAPTPDETHPLEAQQIAANIEALQLEAVGAPSLALDTLLFHPGGTQDWLDAHPDALDPARRAHLLSELSRDQVEVSFRLVDDSGQIRGEATRTSSLREKQHIVMAGTGALKRIEISGKTKRVGLEHLWARW